jgi:hypothetical protein
MALMKLLTFSSDVNDIEISTLFMCVPLMMMWGILTVFLLLPQF